MDELQTKSFISFLMDASDIIEKAKQEMRGIKASGRLLSEEEHEVITELVKGIASDTDIIDSDIFEYARMGFCGKSYVAVKK
jgi:hypothetical protein